MEMKRNWETDALKALNNAWKMIAGNRIDLHARALEVAEEEACRWIDDYKNDRELNTRLVSSFPEKPMIFCLPGPVPGVLDSNIVEGKGGGAIHYITYGNIPRELVQLDENAMLECVRKPVRERIQYLEQHPYTGEHAEISQWRFLVCDVGRLLANELTDQVTEVLKHCPPEKIVSTRVTHRHLYNLHAIMAKRKK